MDTDVALEELMRLALAGDKRAYAQLLEETSRLLLPYLSRRLNRPGEADDVLQEVLISIHKARHTYNCKRPYMPWAFAIARFRLKDHLRTLYSDKLRNAADLSVADIFSVDNVTNEGLTYESIKRDIEQLPEKQGVILKLMHEEGYTSREVAEKTGMTESAVKVAAHRAYKILRKKLGGDYGV